MYESLVENLEKYLVPTSSGQGPHIRWHFEMHTEFTASKGDDTWLFMKIDSNPNITVPNRKGDLISLLTSRSIRIVLPSLVYIPVVSVVLRQVSWLHWTSPVSNGHLRCNSRIYTRFLPQLEKTHEMFPSLEMRPESPALCPEQLRFPIQTRKEPRFAWLNSRESPTTLSQDEKNTDVTPGLQNCSVYSKSNWDEANFPCIGSITTPRSTSYRTSGLTPFRNL